MPSKWGGEDKPGEYVFLCQPSRVETTLKDNAMDVSTPSPPARPAM